MREVTLWGEGRGARPWALASLVCLAASPAWAAAEASYAGSLAAEFFGPLGFAAGSGSVSCVSGHCRLHCSGATACTTDPPAAGPSAPFGGAVLLDAAVDVVKTERGFTADFHITSENNTGPNGSTQGLDWGSQGLTVEVYAPLAAGVEVLATTVYDLGASWTNAEKGARVGLSFEERCRPGGASVSNAGSGSGSKSAADTIACTLAVDGTKTLTTPQGTFRLVQRVAYGMSAGMRFNDGMKSAGRGSITFDFKVKGRVIEKVSGDGQRDILGHQLPSPLVIRTVENDESGTRIATGVPVSFALVDPPSGGDAAAVSPSEAATSTPTGRASARLTLGNVMGTYTVRAACPSCAVPFVDFSAVAVSTPDAAILRELFCDGSGTTDQVMAYPLRVRAVNTYNKREALEGLAVHWSIDPNSPPGGQLTVPSTTTDRHGVARTQMVLKGEGVYTMRATCPLCRAGTTVVCPVTALLPPKISHPASPIAPLMKSTEVPVQITPDIVAPAGTGGTALAQVAIRTPVGNTLVEVAIVPVDYSGGHQHNGTRPTGTFAQTGTNTWSGKTGADGTVLLTYKAGVVGGEEAIETRTFTGEVGREFVHVRVTDLQLLPRATTYILGSNTIDVHPTFSYGKQHLITDVVHVANLYHSSVTGNAAVLSFNDMSLISGGLFDVCHTWSSAAKCVLGGRTVNGHAYHRDGTSVDVNAKEIRKGVAIQRRADLDKLEQLFSARGCCRVPEPTIHFECPASSRCD